MRRLNENWSAYIVGRLHRYNISQKELANECGITPQYLSLVLHGRKHFQTSEGKEQIKRSIFDGLKRLEIRIARGEI